MNESREEQQIKFAKELMEKLNIDLDKEYSVIEINEMLDKYNLKGRFLKFEPTEPHTGEMIIATLVYMKVTVTDAVHKSISLHNEMK